MLSSIAPKNPSPERKESVKKYGLLLALQDHIHGRTVTTHHYPTIFEIFWDILAPRTFGFEYIGIEHSKWQGFIWSTFDVQEDWKNSSGIFSRNIGKYPEIP